MRDKCKHTHTTNHKLKQILGQSCEAQTSFGIRQVVHLFKVTTHGPDNKTSSEDILEVEQKEKKHDQHRLFSAANMNRRNVFSNVNLMIFKLWPQTSRILCPIALGASARPPSWCWQFVSVVSPNNTHDAATGSGSRLPKVWSSRHNLLSLWSTKPANVNPPVIQSVWQLKTRVVTARWGKPRVEGLFCRGLFFSLKARNC